MRLYGGWSFRRALSSYGWLLATVIALAALVVAWLAFNPVQQAAEHVVAPVGRSVGILPSVCPSGWTDTSDAGDHIKVRSCMRDGWLVVLDQDGKFQHGVHLDTPGATFKYMPEEVPGWH